MKCKRPCDKCNVRWTEPKFLLTEILKTIEKRKLARLPQTGPKNGIVVTKMELLTLPCKEDDSRIKATTLSLKTIQHWVSKDAGG